MKKYVLFSFLIFWPWALIAIELAALTAVATLGCKLPAIGPNNVAPCVIANYDLSLDSYVLMAIRNQFATSLLWVLPAAGLVGICQIARWVMSPSAQ